MLHLQCNLRGIKNPKTVPIFAVIRGSNFSGSSAPDRLKAGLQTLKKNLKTSVSPCLRGQKPILVFAFIRVFRGKKISFIRGSAGASPSKNLRTHSCKFVCIRGSNFSASAAPDRLKAGLQTLKNHSISFLCSLRSFVAKNSTSFAARREPRPPKTFASSRLSGHKKNHSNLRVFVPPWSKAPPSLKVDFRNMRELAVEVIIVEAVAYDKMVVDGEAGVIGF